MYAKMEPSNSTPAFPNRKKLWQERQYLTQPPCVQHSCISQNSDPIQPLKHKTDNYHNETMLTKSTELLTDWPKNKASSSDEDAFLAEDFGNLHVADTVESPTQNKFVSSSNGVNNEEQINTSNMYSTRLFRDKHNKLLENIQYCEKCNGKMDFLYDDHDVNAPPLGKVCHNKDCNNFQGGADDTVSVHEVDKALAELKTKLCTNPDCDNSNMYQYQLRLSEEHGYIIYCMKCDTESTIEQKKELQVEQATPLTYCNPETGETISQNLDNITSDKSNELDDEVEATTKYQGLRAWYEWVASPVKKYFERDSKKQRDVRYLKNNVTLASSVAFASGFGKFAKLPLSSFCTMITISGIEIYETIQDIQDSCQERKAGKISGDEFKEKMGQRLGEGITSVGTSTGIAFLCEFGGEAIGSAVAAVGAPYLILPAANIGGMIGYNLGEAIAKYLKQSKIKQS